MLIYSAELRLTRLHKEKTWRSKIPDLESMGGFCSADGGRSLTSCEGGLKKQNFLKPYFGGHSANF